MKATNIVQLYEPVEEALFVSRRQQAGVRAWGADQRSYRAA